MFIAQLSPPSPSSHRILARIAINTFNFYIFFTSSERVGRLGRLLSINLLELKGSFEIG